MTTAAPRSNQREHILDVALRLMGEHGAAGTSMRRLAQACGVQVAAIYHYFESKDALLAAVVAERQYGARLAELTPLDPAAPAADRLRGLFGEVWRGALEEEAIWRLLLGEGIRGEPAVLPVGTALLELLRPAARDWVARWVPEVADPEAVGQLILGQLFAGFVHTMFDPSADRDAIAADAAEVLVRTVLGPAPAPS